MSSEPRHGRVPFYRTLTFRLALVIFLALVVIDSLTIPLWNWLYFALNPEWLDPAYLRAYADLVEGVESERAAAIDGTPESLSDRLWMYAAIVGYVAVYAAILAFFVSRLATRRIRRLSNQVAGEGVDDDRIPGPFDEDGTDEIRLLAATMNRMRERIAGLLSTLDERDRLRSEWVSGVSHDLRAPLTALTASIERSRAIVPDLPEGERRDTLERMLRAAQLDVRRVLDLAEDLLESVKLEDEGELLVEPVPAGELLRNAVDSLRPIAELRGVTIDLRYPRGLPELQADGRRLIRALENVIMNSLEHAREWVRVSASRDAGALVVSVVDDGPGLPESDGRVDLESLGADRGRADSTGIGLTVAARIIEAHRGRIDGRNSADGGASISLILPLASQDRGLSESL